MADYLTFDDAIAVHADLMRRLGRASWGVRDQEALQAVMRLPEAMVFYEEADLIRQAAYLAVGIANLKPFESENIRTAYQIAEVFLALNGLAIDENDTGAPLHLFLRLVVGEHDYERALEFFEARLRPRVMPR